MRWFFNDFPSFLCKQYTLINDKLVCCFHLIDSPILVFIFISNKTGYNLPYLSFKEVYSDGFFIIFGENPFTVSLNHAALANCTITNNHNLDGDFHVFFSHFNNFLGNSNLLTTNQQLIDLLRKVRRISNGRKIQGIQARIFMEG